MQWKYNKRLQAAFIIIGITAAVLLGIKYLLPLFLPFLIALVLAHLLEPLILRIRKIVRINRGLLTGILLLLVGGLFFAVLFSIIEKLLLQVGYLLQNLSLYESRLRGLVYGCCCSLEDWFGIPAETMQNFLLENLTVFIENLQVNFFPQIMDQSIGYIRYLLEAGGVLLITIIATILISKDYQKLKAINRRYVYYPYLKNLGHHLMDAGGTYLKAQLILMGLVALICTLGLLLTRNPYALLVGLAIGALDALPVFGTGSVLIPWAVIEVVQGDFYHAAVYLSLYVICSFLRELLEPKLIGDKLGLPPVAIIIALYIGLHLFGILGVFLGPISLLLIYEIVRELFIHYRISLRK